MIPDWFKDLCNKISDKKLRAYVLKYFQIRVKEQNKVIKHTITDSLFWDATIEENPFWRSIYEIQISKDDIVEIKFWENSAIDLLNGTVPFWKKLINQNYYLK